MGLKNVVVKENHRVELEIEVDAVAFDAAVQRAYEKNVGSINIPGFRKGKAPRAVVERMYGTGVFYEDAMNDVYPVALDAAIRESGYEYVEDSIDLDVVSVGAEGLVFKAVITVEPDVEVGKYQGLRVTRSVAPVTDEDIAAEASRLQERNSRLVSVEGRAAEMGDTVTFDFEGFVDDVAFEGGKAENHTLVLGSGQFIPGFEEQMVGHGVDEAFDVNVTFPEEYHAADLAGKAAVFKCLIHEIQVKELPELDDELIKDSTDFETVDAWKADVVARLTASREEAADAEVENQIVDKLIAGMKGDIPAAMVENRINENVREFEYRLQSQGLSLEMYLQYTNTEMAAFRDSFRERSERQVKLRLILKKIVKLENIEVTDEDIEAEYAKYAEQYQMPVENIRRAIAEDILRSDLAVDKAMKFVKDATTVAKPRAKKAKAAAEESAAEEPADAE